MDFDKLGGYDQVGRAPRVAIEKGKHPLSK